MWTSHTELVKINIEMQGYLQNIRLVVEQKRWWFNKTYTSEINENSFIFMSKHGIIGRKSEEIDHFEIDSLKLRHMRSSLGSIEDSLIIFVLLIPDFVEEEYKTEIVVPIPNRSFTHLDIQTTKTVTVQDVTCIVKEENILYRMKVVYLIF